MTQQHTDLLTTPEDMPRNLTEMQALVATHLAEALAFLTADRSTWTLNLFIEMIYRLKRLAVLIDFGPSNLADSQTNAPAYEELMQQVQQLVQATIADSANLAFVRTSASIGNEHDQIAAERYITMAEAEGAGMAEETRGRIATIRQICTQQESAAKAKMLIVRGQINIVFDADKTALMLADEPETADYIAADGTLTVNGDNWGTLVDLLPHQDARASVLHNANNARAIMTSNAVEHANTRLKLAEALNVAYGRNWSWTQWAIYFAGMDGTETISFTDQAIDSLSIPTRLELQTWKQRLDVAKIYKSDDVFYAMNMLKLMSSGDEGDDLVPLEKAIAVMTEYFGRWFGLKITVKPWSHYADDGVWIALVEGAPEPAYIILDMVARSTKLDNGRCDGYTVSGTRIGLVHMNVPAESRQLSREDLVTFLHEFGHIAQLILADISAYPGAAIEYPLLSMEVGSTVLEAMLADPDVQRAFGIKVADRKATYIGEALTWYRQAMFSLFMLQLFNSQRDLTEADLAEVRRIIDVKELLDTPTPPFAFGFVSGEHVYHESYGPLYVSYVLAKVTAEAIAELVRERGVSVLAEMYAKGALYSGDYVQFLSELFGQELKLDAFARQLEQVYT